MDRGALGDGASSFAETECPRPLVLVDRETSEFCGLIPCRTWACDSCSLFLRRRLYARVSAAFDALPKAASAVFLTFTVRRLDWASRKTCASVVQVAWRRWLQSVRKGGWQGDFVRVVELHKSGVPHLHVLATARLPVDFLSVLWNRCLAYAWKRIVGAPTFDSKLLQVRWLGTIDAKPASRRKCLSYLTKYVSKGADRSRLLAVGVRRVWSSSVGFLPPIFRIATTSGKRQVMTMRGYDEFIAGQEVPVCGRVTVDGVRCLDSTGRNVSSVSDSPVANGEKPESFLDDKPMLVFVDGSASLPGTDKGTTRRKTKPKRKKVKQDDSALSPVHSEQSDRWRDQCPRQDSDKSPDRGSNGRDGDDSNECWTPF